MMVAPYRFGNGITDPNWASVVFLNGFDGANYLTEQSTAARTGTYHASVGSGVATGGKFGVNCFKANAGFIDYADNADWSFGSGAFTVETWAQFNSAPSSGFHHLVGQYDTGTGQGSFALSVASNVLTLYRTANGTTQSNVTGAWTPTTGVWYHVAADFDGTKTRLYVDGVMKGSSTTAVTLFSSSAAFTVGAIMTNGAVNSNFNGWVDEVRVTKGVARYASDAGFTAPIAAFPRS